MSNKDLLEYLVKELLVEREVSEQLNNFEQLYPLITKCEIHTYETEFSHIVKLHLNSGNLDLQKCALTLLNICLTELQIVIKEHLYIDTAYQIVEIAFSGTVDSIENQELWLKAFTAISLLEDVFKELCKHRTVQIVSILTTSLSSLTNSVQKVKALQMFNKLLSNIEPDNVSEEIQNMLVSLWRQPIFPMTFQDVAISIQKAALVCAKSLLPYVHKYLRTSNEVWKEIGVAIQEEYIPLMSNLIEQKNDLYGDLWIYLIKLIGDKINTGVPVLNSLLSVIENAFKSVSFDIRITAFNCWKVLIESMFLNPNADYTSRRIKLLIIPLKTNNSKTEELTRVKFETWFTLLNVLKTKNACNAVGIVDLFLSFCFGPLDSPLKSYIHPANISPGKKYFRFHLTCCRALLQIMGDRKYITQELLAKLKKFSINGPILTLDGFVQISEIVVNSVGECSVMLSNLQVQDDCVQMNQAVWKSLFNFVDGVQDEESQTKIIKQVAAVIIAIVSLARKKPNLIHFSILPLFDNIISNEFKFFNEDIMFELIFLPMLSSVLKKDKALLRPEIIPLFEKIFLFKRHSRNFITFLDSFMKRITVVPREELPMDKLEVLQSLWFLVEPELVVLLANARGQSVDESLYISLYKEYLYWPAASFYRFSREAVVSKWKNMYNLFGQCLTSVLQIKLANVLMKDLYTFIQKNPNVIILAELVYFVIQNLHVEECTEDNCADVYDVYNGLKNIVLLSDLSADTLDIYQSCLTHVLVTSSTLPYLHRVIQPITDCLDSILNQHKKTGVLAAVYKFFTTLKYTDNLESHIVSMVDNLKSLPTLTVELTRLVTTAESVTKIKFDFEKSKESSPSEQSSKNPNKTSDKKEKELRISLLGHDVDTMTPIKVKGSMLKDNITPPKQPKSQLPVSQTLTKDDDNFVVVDTPYKFDPKKLTKKQKSKLSRRRDDIPALYQDLSQSQSQSLCSNSESFSELPVLSENNQEETAVKLTENVDNDLNGIKKTEEITESVRPFAELSNSSSMKEKTKMSLLENSTPTTNVNTAVPAKRGRRKSTGTMRKDMQQRNGNVLDYVDIIFTDSEEQRSSPVQQALADRGFTSDSEIIRKRVQKELQRIKIDVNDGEEYKNKSTRRRTRSDYNNIPEDLIDNKKRKRSKRNLELTAKVDLNNSASTKVNEKSEKKSVEIKPLTKPPEVSIEKEIRDSSKLLEPIQMETDSEPVIESSQERELNCKPFKIPALHQFQKIKPGEHIVIKDCQSTIDLVVKGPKETSPFKVINKSGVIPKSGRILFPKSNDSETPDSIEQPKIAETDTNNLEKQNNSVKDQIAMECDNNSSVCVPEESNNSNTEYMSHLHIETDSTNVTLDTTNCEEIGAASSNKDTVQVNPNDTTVSINSQLLAELDAAHSNTVAEIPNDDEVCRKVVFNTSVLSDESVDKDKVNKKSEFDSPPRNVQCNNIVTSPICSDTPTRNSELIRNTVEISPIKDVPNQDSDVTFIHTDSVNNSVIASASTRSEQDNGDETKKNEISPLLFSNDTTDEINKSDSDNKKDMNATPNSHIMRKNKSKYLSSRGAQMMNMVSANTPSGTNGAKKHKVTSKFSDNKPFFSPKQSRIAKMMGQFQKNDDQESDIDSVGEPNISEQDIFSFSKELPRPTDSPSCSILRKRKVPDFAEDGMSPASKRKRVNFSDPEVTCRKFIERNARCKYTVNNKLVDVIPQEPRVTRSSKKDSDSTQNVSEAIQHEPEPIQHEPGPIQRESEPAQNVSDQIQNESEPAENQLESVEDKSEPVTDDYSSTPTFKMIAAPTKNIFTGAPIDSLFAGYSFSENINAQLNKQTSAEMIYDDTRPICSDLVTCTDAIKVILPNLTTPDFIGAYASLLKEADIHTVADLAQLTELKVHELPLKVERVKKILKEHSERVQGNTPTKPTRKIKPVTLASVLEFDDETRTESVIIPLGYKDMNGPAVSDAPTVPTVDGTEESAPDSESLFSESHCELKTEMDIDDNLTSVKYLPSTSSARLTESPINGQQSSPKYVSPPIHNSPSSPKENILDVKLNGVPVQEIATSLMLLMNDRKHDPKPLVQLLFGGTSNLTNTVVSMGLFKVHHLTYGQKWESIIGDIVTHIGIWQLVQYLCKMQSVPVNVIVESVLKHSDQLSPIELLKYVTRVCTLTDILQQYDTTALYQSLSELCTDKRYNVPQFRDVVRELYPVIIDNPSGVSSQISHLSVVEIGNIVIDRFGESPDMDVFVDTIYKKVPLDRYLKPVPRKLLAPSASPKNTTETDDDDVTGRLISQIKKSTLDSSARKQLFQAICAQMNWMELSECYSEEIRKKYA